MEKQQKRLNSRKKDSPAMTLIDYNGTGEWSCEAIQQRYHRYAHNLKLASPADLTPSESRQGMRHWVYPVMQPVIEAIDKNDPAAIQIGIEFIEQDQHFPFGRILKSNTARALRRATLTSGQKERIRVRIVQMLLEGRVPHEYQEHAKLLRRIGLEGWWPVIEENTNRSNPYVMRYYRYFQRHVLPEQPSQT